MDPKDKEVYAQAFAEHLDRGDDYENARARIVDAGCPVEVADEIKAEFEEAEGEDEDDGA